ncbi:MAG: hypothetical protein KBT03_12025 [Bacteroidales bacterium]|nr:hypothetical protein [Candidatus Scybalousia scybalohippi]
MEDKMLEALTLIKETCMHQESCRYCELSGVDGTCGINKGTPDQWIIEQKKITKYLG